jgi:hypothetical protein
MENNIWMGNRKGVTFLSAPHKKFSYQQLVSHITGMRLFYKPIDLLQFTDNEGVREANIPKGLKFRHNQNDITFDYIAINLREPEKNSYEYRLIGYDKKWSPPVKQTSMTYTNLDPGKYTFELRESNNEVYWSNDNISKASFQISPPYWDTWWFVSGEIAFLVLLLLSTIVFTRRLRNKGTIKFMLYMSLFIIFEYLHTLLEPYLEGVSGGAPIFQVMMHTMLALVLFPIENLTTNHLMKRKKAKEAAEKEKSKTEL